MRRWLILLLLACLLPIAAVPADAAGKRKQAAQLEKMQAAFSAAMRWGEVEQAWELVDPAYREANPLAGLVLERYQQVQISGYVDRNSSAAENGDVLRNIELRVINKHTMAERTLRHREQWRWDPVAKRWWLVNGLPDLWSGE